ncbi:MAG: hypothetical protein IT288_05365 [Bdellovibrionales bacterium]|nr:hypothetical protein [Bdellovibrionales bacterium]
MGCGRIFKMVVVSIGLSIGVSSAVGEELNIQREKLELNFNAMIEDVNKEGAAIAESIQGDIVPTAGQPAREVSDTQRVREFLDVEMGLGDASSVVKANGQIKAQPSTPIPNREEPVGQDSAKSDDRGPSSQLAQKGMGAKKLAPN